MRAERNRKDISPALTRDRQMYVLSFPCLSCGVAADCYAVHKSAASLSHHQKRQHFCTSFKIHSHSTRKRTTPHTDAKRGYAEHRCGVYLNSVYQYFLQLNISFSGKTQQRYSASAHHPPTYLCLLFLPQSPTKRPLGHVSPMGWVFTDSTHRNPKEGREGDN